MRPGRGPVPGLGSSLPVGSFRQLQPVAGGPAGRAGGACCALRVPAGIPGVICGYPRRRSLARPAARERRLYRSGTVRDRSAAGAQWAGAAHRVRPGTLRTCWPPPGCVNLRLESWCWRELWSSARHFAAVLAAASGKHPFTSPYE